MADLQLFRGIPPEVLSHPYAAELCEQFSGCLPRPRKAVPRWFMLTVRPDLGGLAYPVKLKAQDDASIQFTDGRTQQQQGNVARILHDEFGIVASDVNIGLDGLLCAERLPVEGASAGLLYYLISRAIITRGKLRCSVAATGMVLPDGTVKEVRGVNEKLQAVMAEIVPPAIVYVPSENTSVTRLPRGYHLIKVKHVRDIRHAEYLSGMRIEKRVPVNVGDMEEELNKITLLMRNSNEFKRAWQLLNARMNEIERIEKSGVTQNTVMWRWRLAECATYFGDGATAGDQLRFLENVYNDRKLRICISAEMRAGILATGLTDAIDNYRYSRARKDANELRALICKHSMSPDSLGRAYGTLAQVELSLGQFVQAHKDTDTAVHMFIRRGRPEENVREYHYRANICWHQALREPRLRTAIIYRRIMAALDENSRIAERIREQRFAYLDNRLFNLYYRAKTEALYENVGMARKLCEEALRVYELGSNQKHIAALTHVVRAYCLWKIRARPNEIRDSLRQSKDLLECSYFPYRVLSIIPAAFALHALQDEKAFYQMVIRVMDNHRFAGADALRRSFAHADSMRGRSPNGKSYCDMLLTIANANT